MVYCGKPSKGCGQCRTRKIRCDQARPVCSQCVRAKRECPGYRDQLSLMFRDESESVVRKAETGSAISSTASARTRGSSRRSTRAASQERNIESTLTVSNTVDLNPMIDFSTNPQRDFLAQHLWRLPLEVQPSHQSQQEAIAYFLRSSASSGAVWMLDFMPNLLTQTGGSISTRAMQSSMAAVSSAMLSRIRNISPLREMARKEYVSALALLNSALTNPEEAKSNQTLGAVILLAMYEIVTSRAPQDMDLWTNHITGATALLELRGPEQLQTEVGMRLFMHLRYQIIISCIQRDARVPDSILECAKFVLHLRPIEAYGNRLIITIGKLSNLRADIKEGKFTSDEAIVSAASAIDAELTSWIAALPPAYSYEKHTISPYDFTFEERCRGLAPYDDQYYVYPNFWVCNTWNQYRCARIIVSDIILAHVRQISEGSSLNLLSDEFRLHCKTLRATIRRLAVDLCRSVPYHFGAHLKSPSTDFPPPESYIGGLMLLWPMFLAGVVENPRHALREWVVQCLKMIGHSMGMDQALALRDLVVNDPGILSSSDSEAENSRVSEVPDWIMSVKRSPVSLIQSHYHNGIRS